MTDPPDTPDDNQKEKPEPTLEELAKLDPATLTPEQQMALYEKSLQDEDWGHQPC